MSSLIEPVLFSFAAAARLGSALHVRARSRSRTFVCARGSVKIREFVGLLLGKALVDDLPHPQADLDGFVAGLKRSLAHTPRVWDPLRKCPHTWMNVDKIRTAGRREIRCSALANTTGAGVVAECNCVIA